MNIPTKTLSDSKGWIFSNSYAKLPQLFFTAIDPSPVPAPELVIGNHRLAQDLGLDSTLFENQTTISAFAGNHIFEGSHPIAQAYAGHQFGHFNVLGDGRAILLGEQITPEGNRFDIQLKGSGQTPYSRRGDGRAALGPMLREYLISEAMYALGIPTTRSLAVVATGSMVYREYPLPGAVLTRVAASHIRVGTFQYAGYRGSFEELKTLANYTFDRHFPTATREHNHYQTLLREVIAGQASLLAKWQQVGFIHGVMNTDNMAICGETIDYGPCAFMDNYDPATVFSSIDNYGRYSYENQPKMALWNLTRFAETLLPLLDKDQTTAIAIAQELLEEFNTLYNSFYLEGMRKKIGITTVEDSDQELIDDLLEIMHRTNADFTNTFRNLFDSEHPEFHDWKLRWIERLNRQGHSDSEIKATMNSHNPVIIPRNHLVEKALSLASRQNDLSLFNRLLAALENPYEYCEDFSDLYDSPVSINENYRTFCGT